MTIDLRKYITILLLLFVVGFLIGCNSVPIEKAEKWPGAKAATEFCKYRGGVSIYKFDMLDGTRNGVRCRDGSLRFVEGIVNF